MKRFFLRAVAYVGLYSEIFAASCRWLSYVPPGWSRRDRWKSDVTRSLIVAGYLPPTREAVETAQEQRRINSEHEALVWIAAQPETIKTCLKINQRALAALRLQKYDPDQYLLVMDSPPGPAIPVFCKKPELWINILNK